jgi:hypothetical protein
MDFHLNPFKFQQVIRKGAAVLIQFDVEGQAYTFTVSEIQFRINHLRNDHGFSDYEMAQELQGLEEAKKEIQKDAWPTTIDSGIEGI